MATTSAAPRRSQPAPGVTSSRFTLAQVIGRAVTARNTVTFWLAAPGTTRAPAPYQPGQFVTLALPDSARRVMYRSYSLCGDGRPDQPWEITVKRRSDGQGSGFLHDHVTPGMTLPVSAPGGAFTLPQRADADANQTIIFVAAGSGVTPIYGMLRALAARPSQQRPQVHLHYAYHSPQDAIYGDAITALDPHATWLRQTRYVSTAGQRLSAAQLSLAAGAQARLAQWYLCGPTDLMAQVEAAARAAGVAPEHIHIERFFSPQQRAAQAASGAVIARVRVRVAETGAILQTRPGETLLETLERHGYDVDFSCRAGACGACRLKTLGGKVACADGQALTPAERAAGYVESCVARPIGDVAVSLAGAANLRPVTTRATHAVLAMPVAGGARAATRATTRRKARWTLAVASLALFGMVWNLTDHKITSAASATTTTSSSGSGSSSSSTSSSASNSSNSSSASSSSNSSSSSGSSSSSSSNGSSGFSSQPSQSGSSSSTGAS